MRGKITNALTLAYGYVKRALKSKDINIVTCIIPLDYIRIVIVILFNPLLHTDAF